MPFALGARSLARLEGVHPDLVKVVQLAIRKSDLDFAVLEGRRTVDRQRQLFGQGATKTMNSRHLTGHAVDLAALDEAGRVTWARPAYEALASQMKTAAAAEGVPVEWGGDWRSFFDGPHFQLPWSAYPA